MKPRRFKKSQYLGAVLVNGSGETHQINRSVAATARVLGIERSYLHGILSGKFHSGKGWMFSHDADLGNRKIPLVMMSPSGDIREFESIHHASRVTGQNSGSISAKLSGKRPNLTLGGWEILGQL